MSTNIQNKTAQINKTCSKTCFSLPKRDAKNDRSLDTLAQLSITPDIVQSIKNLSKRAKAKYLTNAYLFKLIDLHSILHDKYWDTWWCSKNLIQKDKEITATYCNNRWCIVCNRIRTAKLINHYKPLIDKIDENDMYFLTLSRKNVTEKYLKTELNTMIKTFRVITATLNSRYRKGKGNKLYAIRKTECVISLIKEFNLHFHLILKGKENAELIRSEWLRKSGDLADPDAQDIQKIKKDKLNELFKYTTKIITDSKGEKKIYTKELNTIFEAFYKRRTIQPYGFQQINEDVEDIDSQIYDDIEEYDSIRFIEFSEYDWYYLDSGEALTGYVPDEKTEKIVTNIK